MSTVRKRGLLPTELPLGEALRVYGNRLWVVMRLVFLNLTILAVLSVVIHEDSSYQPSTAMFAIWIGFLGFMGLLLLLVLKSPVYKLRNPPWKDLWLLMKVLPELLLNLAIYQMTKAMHFPLSSIDRLSKRLKVLNSRMNEFLFRPDHTDSSEDESDSGDR